MALAPYPRKSVLFGHDGFSLSLICEVEKLCIKEEDEAKAVISKKIKNKEVECLVLKIFINVI